MPIHDWTRVDANLFHDFHQTWTVGIRNALNGGVLPRGFSALVGQRVRGVAPPHGNRVAIRRPLDRLVAIVMEFMS
jgi:hypothetical protein